MENVRNNLSNDANTPSSTMNFKQRNVSCYRNKGSRYLLNAFLKKDHEEILQLTQDLPSHAKSSIQDIIDLFEEHRSQGMTPFIAAILHENICLCLRLVDDGIDLGHKEKGMSKTIDKEEIMKFQEETEKYLLLGPKSGAFNDFNKTTPMFWAIRCGYMCLVEKLIQSGFKVNSPTETVQGMSALSLAIRDKKVDLVEKLLELSADVHSKDLNLETPLDEALGASHLNIIKLLMLHGEQPSCKHHKMSPILKAITNGNIAAVKLLVELGANTNLGYINDQQVSPILCAIAYCRYEIANYLIQSNALVTAYDEKGDTALHLLTNKNEPSIKMKVNTAKRLIEKGADVNAKNLMGETPLFGACKALIPELVELFLSMGAKVKIRNNNKMLPLSITLESGFDVKTCSTKKRPEVLIRKPDDELVLAKQLKITHLLLSYGADVESRERNGGTPLHSAVSSSNFELIELLLKRGANVNCQDNDGIPPLFVAIIEKDLKSAQYLIDNGADVNMKDYYGKFALVVALERDYDSCKGAKFLVDNGADIHATNHQGFTSLHLAALTGNTKTASLLIDAGATLNAKSKINFTPFDCAMLSPFLAKAKIIKNFFEHGFDPNETDEYGLTPYQYVTGKQDPELLKTFWYYGYHYNEIEEGKVNSILVRRNASIPLPHVTNSLISTLKILTSRNELSNIVLHGVQKKFLRGVKNNDKQLVLDSLKKGAVARGCNKELQNPLHYLVEKRFHDVLEILLKHSVPTNVVDSNGLTPLQLAVRGGDLQGCRLLLQYGALYKQMQGDHSQQHQNDEMRKLFQTIDKVFRFVRKGNSEALKMIETSVLDQDLELFHILMNCVNGKGQTVISAAVDYAQTNIIYKLMAMKIVAPDLC